MALVNSELLAFFVVLTFRTTSIFEIGNRWDYEESDVNKGELVRYQGGRRVLRVKLVIMLIL